MHSLSFLMRGILYCLHTLVWLALASVMVGCGPGDGSPGLPGGPATCSPGEMPLEGGGCQPAGLPPDMQCPPGETPLEGGGCQPAGVPPDGCGQGFVHDGQGGCNAILPPDPCPPGQMAIPGETQCREVAPCGTGDYGMIPIDADTQFVNAAYPGNDSNGTQARPWKRIQDGIGYAKSGAIVAVAAGSYVEDLWIHHRPVRLWGRCPALVEVVGTGTYNTLEISTKPASHSEVHHLAITGPQGGILTFGSTDVIVDRVWIHDTAARGIGVQDGLGGQNVSTPTSITISNSLIETTTDVGVFVGGSQATVESTVVRATRLLSDGTAGSGIVLMQSPATDGPAMLTLRTSLLEQNHEAGLLLSGSNATMESTVVRATQPRSDGTRGRGIHVQPGPTTQRRSTLMLRTSLLEQNHDFGLFVLGSDATIEATVVHATQPRSDGTLGRGINIQPNLTTQERSTLMLRTSLLEQNHDIGLFVAGSDATMEATVVRGTQPLSNGKGGRGIGVQPNPTTHERSTLTLRTSLLEQNHEAGLFVGESDATIEATVVRGTQPLSNGTGGFGITVQSDRDTPERSTLMLRTSLLEQNHGGGVVVVGSDATIERTVVRGTQTTGNGTIAGDGIAVDADIDGAPAMVAITSSQIESNARAGISNFNSEVILIASRIQCNKINLDGEDFVPGQPFTFDGSKDNVCGCADEPDPTCPVRSASLSPPEPILPVEPSP